MNILIAIVGFHLISNWNMMNLLLDQFADLNIFIIVSLTFTFVESILIAIY